MPTDPSDPGLRSAREPALTDDERRRYARQLLLPEVGEAGQARLRGSRVLLVGIGGLGSPCALYLAAAGVGTLGVVDGDAVDVSNLPRQVAYGTADVGQRKVDAAEARLRDLNPHVRIERHDGWLTSATALALIGTYDVVVDGTDNFATRYLVNDACVLAGRPNVYASVSRFDGQASVFGTPGGPCYRCLHPVPPPPGTVRSCAEAGVLGVLPGLLGTIQATETLKLLLGIGATLAGRLLLVDALAMQVHTVAIDRDPDCPACGTRTLTALIDYEAFCGPASGVGGGDVPAIDAPTLRARLTRGDRLTLLDVREPDEVAGGAIPGARLVPLATVPAVAATLDPAADYVVICRSGQRSAVAVRQLMALGVRRVASLSGGMQGWMAP